jgi:hypothetical protein
MVMVMSLIHKVVLLNILCKKGIPEQIVVFKLLSRKELVVDYISNSQKNKGKLMSQKQIELLHKVLKLIAESDIVMKWREKNCFADVEFAIDFHSNLYILQIRPHHSN